MALKLSSEDSQLMIWKRQFYFSISVSSFLAHSQQQEYLLMWTLHATLWSGYLAPLVNMVSIKSRHWLKRNQQKLPPFSTSIPLVLNTMDQQARIVEPTPVDSRKRHTMTTVYDKKERKNDSLQSSLDC